MKNVIIKTSILNILILLTFSNLHAQQLDWMREVFRTGNLTYSGDVISIMNTSSSIYVQGTVGKSTNLSPYSTNAITIYRDSLYVNGSSKTFSDIYISKWDKDLNLIGYKTILLPNSSYYLDNETPVQNTSSKYLYYPLNTYSDSINVDSVWENTGVDENKYEFYSTILKYYEDFNYGYFDRIVIRDSRKGQVISKVFTDDIGVNTFILGNFRDSLWFNNQLLITAPNSDESSFIIKMDEYDNVIWSSFFNKSLLLNAFFNKTENCINVAANLFANADATYYANNALNKNLSKLIAHNVLLGKIDASNGSLLKPKNYILSGGQFLSGGHYFGNDNVCLLMGKQNDSLYIHSFDSKDTFKQITSWTIDSLSFYPGYKLNSHAYVDTNNNFYIVASTKGNSALDKSNTTKISDYIRNTSITYFGYYRFFANYNINGKFNHASVFEPNEKTSSLKIHSLKNSNEFYISLLNTSLGNAGQNFGIAPRIYKPNPFLNNDYFIAKYNCKPTAYFSLTTSQNTINCKNLSTSYCNYSWNFGGSGASDSISPSYTFTSGGKKQIQLIAKNACGADTFTQEVDITVKGISTIYNDEVQIYPNPTKELFTIEGDMLKTSHSVIVFDICGKKIVENTFSTSSNQISLNGNTQGVYIVQIILENGIEKSYKLIKE